MHMFYCSWIIFDEFKHADIKDVGSAGLCEQYVKIPRPNGLFRMRPRALWQTHPHPHPTELWF